MSESFNFPTRKAFRDWLSTHAQTSEGIWLLFEKGSNSTTLSAQEALEEALCFGWIDGVMKRLDDTSYIKYFSMRRKNSKWSDKNKKIVANLEKQQLLTPLGLAKIQEALENGQWENSTKPSAITEEQISKLASLLQIDEVAYTNFLAMSLSVKKTYTRAYEDAKTKEGQKRRLQWMLERLRQNLKPM